MTDLSRASLLSQYGARAEGLTENEVLKQRLQYGWNELPEKKASLLRLFLAQFTSLLVLILIAAAAVSLLLPYFFPSSDGHDALSAIIILAIVVINAVFGFLQEWRAGNAIASLRTLSGPEAKVRRDGVTMMVQAKELVPGDLIVLEAGDRISVDAALVAASSLDIDESSLTGESVPVAKSVTASKEEASFRSNMVYAGTLVTRGFGEAVVQTTGLLTEIGKITSMVMAAESPETPLQRDLRKVGQKIGIVVLILCAAIFATGIAVGRDILEMFFVAISLAVAAVPEGLPAVVTVCLAMGVTRMARKNALVRKLDAVETLGSVSVIAADKTGTMTENRMTVTDVWMMPGVTKDRVLLAAASCSHAELPDIGDPTEIALLRAAADASVERLVIDTEEVPFTSEAKYMVTAHTLDGRTVRFAKGALEALEKMTHQEHVTLQSKNADYAAEGLRVLAVAEGTDKEMQIIGLVAMMDPPREAVKAAIVKAKQAGIRTLMITGDHPATAYSIADRVGLQSDGVLTGGDLDELSDDELLEKLKTVSVFARVRPEHKVRVLSLLQQSGEIVSMTGDGVNDAPALKQAHVGVGMGKVGTDTARESSSIVLTDDNYATIVSAVEEGRRIYDNIRRFVLFLMRSNVGEVLTIALSMFLALPLPLLPLHILWVNLVTDSFPALALAMEPGSPHLMSRRPRSSNVGIFTGEWSLLLLAGAINAILCILVFSNTLTLNGDLTQARTVSLTALILFQFFLAYSVRTRRFSLFMRPFSNRWLIASIIVSLGLHVWLLHSSLGSVMGLMPLTLAVWSEVFLATIIAFFVFEILKVVLYRMHAQKDREIGLVSA